MESEVVDLKVVDGILYGTYKVTEIDLNTAIKAVETRLKFQNGKIHKCIVDASRLKNVTSDARKFLSSKKAYEGFEAVAFIINSPLGVVLINFYLKFGSFPVPTKLFRNLEQAERWVKNVVV
ncbi:MAG: hypothetical protein JXQ87_13640 [Bacteroidia bacterium]